MKETLSSLFEELVPEYGPAATLAGEIVRAVNKIDYRYYNDGDKVAIGYGRETCNPAARYLRSHCDDYVKEIVNDMMRRRRGTSYEDKLELLKSAVVNYISCHSELKYVDNDDDMLNY